MHDDCWRELLLAEHKGQYLRVSVPKMTEAALKQWIKEAVPEQRIYVNEIEAGSRWSWGEASYQFGERYPASRYEFPNHFYKVWYTYVKDVMFVWFEDQKLALLFKLTFGDGK